MNQKNFIKGIFLDVKESFKRFPMSHIFSIFVAVLGVYLVGRADVSNDFIKAMFSSLLGISLSIATYLYFERIKSKKLKYFSHFIPVAFVIAHFFLTRSDFTLNYVLKILQLFIAFHLFISVAPFLFKNETNGFWHFNRILLQRFLFAVFYSAVLFLGLSLALAFTSYLFDLKFTENVYIRLWILCVFVFQIWILLPGVPQNFKLLNSICEYPSGLKIFTQYMLVPLVLLYSIILYFYLGKILISWNLPKGLVGWMVSSMGMFGVLCLLLLHPIKEKLETKWTQIFEKYFYYFILPLLGMLFLGLFTRIEDYGFTEKRYFLFVLATWLFIIAVYFKISKSTNIKVIPISLLVLSLITSIGPWGAYQVSLNNQIGTLKLLLEENKILAGSQISKKSGDISFGDKKKISSSLDYILENHGAISLKALFSEQQLKPFLGSETKKNSFLSGDRSKVTELMMRVMGLQYIPRWQREETEQSFDLYFESDLNEAAFSILGYQSLFNFDFYEDKMEISNLGYVVQADFEKSIIKMYKNNKLLIAVPISDYIKKLQEKEKKREDRIIPFRELSFDYENAQFKIKIYFSRLSSFYRDGSLKISSMSGSILMSEKGK